MSFLDGLFSSIRVMFNDTLIAPKPVHRFLGSLIGVSANDELNTVDLDFTDLEAAAIAAQDLADDVAANTAAIAENAEDIADNAAAIAGFTDQSAAIAANTAAIESNDDDIAALAGSVANNAAAIATTNIQVAVNTADIAALGGGGTSGAYVTVVFRPGATADEPSRVYDDWETTVVAVESLIASGYRGTLTLDGGENGGVVVIPASVLDIDGADWLIKAVNVDRVLVDSGSYIRNATEVDLGGAELVTTGTGLSQRFVFDGGSSEEFSIRGTSLKFSGTNPRPLVYVSNGSPLSVINLDDVDGPGDHYLIEQLSPSRLTVNCKNMKAPVKLAYASGAGTALGSRLTVNWYGTERLDLNSLAGWTAGEFVVNNNAGNRSELPTNYPTGTDIACYNFAGDGSIDESGDNRDLTLSGTMPFAPGHKPGALAFNADDSTILVTRNNADMRIAGALTVEALLYQYTTSTQNGYIVVCGNADNDPSNNRQYQIYVDASGVLQYVHESGSGVNRTVALGAAPVGRWYLLTVTRDSSGTQLNAYIDGDLVSRPAALAAAPDNGSATVFAIGSNDTGGERFEGLIGGVRVRDAEESAQTIRERARTILGLTPDPKYNDTVLPREMGFVGPQNGGSNFDFNLATLWPGMPDGTYWATLQGLTEDADDDEYSAGVETRVALRVVSGAVVWVATTPTDYQIRAADSWPTETTLNAGNASGVLRVVFTGTYSSVWATVWLRIDRRQVGAP